MNKEKEQHPRLKMHRPEGGGTLSVAGLFSGIGGLEAGLRNAGHNVVLLCEKDEAARSVLVEQFSRVVIKPDVKKIDHLPRNTGLLTAGFPCQDLSQCGRTAGIGGKQSGLVEHVFRLLRRRPIPWVLLENVPFMLHLDGGKAMSVIVEKLEGLHYKWAYRVVDSQSFGVPQRRKRVFLLAALEHDPRGVLLAEDAGTPEDRETTDTAIGFYWSEGNKGLGLAVDSVPPLKGGSQIPCPPAMILPSGDVWTPDIRDAERLQGFDADWTKPAEEVKDVSRSIRWKLIGNAVTVNVAQWIGSRILKPGVYDADGDRPLKEGTAWPKAAWCDGNERRSSSVSPWPVQIKATPLEDFLEFPGKDLSARATEGFLTRVRKSSLRRPDGFDAALEAHLERMKAAQEKERKLKNSAIEIMKSALLPKNGAHHGNGIGNGNGHGRTGGRRPHVRANVASAAAGHRS